MDITRMTYLLAVFVVTANIGLCSAGHVVGEDDWWRHQLVTSYDRSLRAMHPDPVSEVHLFNNHVHKALEASNGRTRRGLAEPEPAPEFAPLREGECLAENPIDQCWRCKADWAQNRKRLADCGMGFGRYTTGGKAGEFYTVNDSSDEDLINPKPGTLRFAVLQPQPLWIIFSGDMNIKLLGELLITSNKTIDGRGFKIEISQGAGLTIRFAQNVIIHNLKIHDIVQTNGGMMREGPDHVGMREPDDGDGLCIFASSNIWVDHVSMSNCKDGLIDIVSASTAVSVTNCHFIKHNYVMLFGGSDTSKEDVVMQVTVAFNNFGKELQQRMPRCRFGFFHVVNNDYTHWEMYAIGGSNNATIISQGNRYTAPPNPRCKEVTMRNNAPGKEWETWIWRSQEDLMLNGAFFRESGIPLPKPPNDQTFIQCRPGSMVGRLTRFSGHLTCKEGKPC